MSSQKKVYVTPDLTVYGNLEEITMQGGSPNSDLPHGNNNTAYSPG